MVGVPAFAWWARALLTDTWPIWNSWSLRISHLPEHQADEERRHAPAAVRNVMYRESPTSRGSAGPSE